MRRCPLVILISLMSNIIVAAQSKEITKSEFSDTYYVALAKSENFQRRLISRLDHYLGNKIDRTEHWTYEFVPPYRRRILYEKSEGPKLSRIGEVSVDGEIFCRIDFGSWNKSNELCLTGQLRSRSQAAFQVVGKISSIYTVEAVVEDGVNLRLFREYTKYKNISPTNAEREKLWFAESKYWLNSNGLVVRQETITGLVHSKQLRTSWVDTYDFATKNFTIESPIK
jgi:hypothetical protein